MINHSQTPGFEAIHGNVLNFNTETKRCPFPTAFLWHEYRVRGFHPTRNDRAVNFKKIGGGLSSGGFSGGSGAGVDDGHESYDSGGDRNGGSGAGEQIDGHASGQDDPITASSFHPARMSFDGDEFSAWLKAAKQHSSWRDCVMENTSWSGTAEQNIEKYNHEVLPQLS